TALYPYEAEAAREVASADRAAGAVLGTGALAPHVVTRPMVQALDAGGVKVDSAIDRGRCFETSRPTSWQDPVFVEHGVTHFCVGNMPGAVPRTASQAISAAILPWVDRLASGDWRGDAALVRGLNVERGELRHPALQSMKL